MEKKSFSFFFLEIETCEYFRLRIYENTLTIMLYSICMLNKNLNSLQINLLKSLCQFSRAFTDNTNKFHYPLAVSAD